MLPGWYGKEVIFPYTYSFSNATDKTTEIWRKTSKNTILSFSSFIIYVDFSIYRDDNGKTRFNYIVRNRFSFVIYN